jgi:hypothetical protein
MHFLLTGQEPLALTVCSPRDINPDISEATDLIVGRSTQQDVYLRYQSALEMKDELEYVSDAEVEEKPGFRWLELTVGALVMFLSVGGWFAYTKYLELEKQAQSRLETAKMEQSRLEKMLQDKSRDLDLLKRQVGGPVAYGSAASSTSTAAPGASAAFEPVKNNGQEVEVGKEGLPAEQISALNPGSAKTEGQDTVLQAEVPLEDSEEAHMTDPDALSPMEEDTQR